MLDAEALYRELLRRRAQHADPTTRPGGYCLGGAWLAERLQKTWAWKAPPGAVIGDAPR